jgi:CMP-N,N'-diacetyllegionaminic acid synthase
MANIIALIPARSGSKGVPGKNMRSLGGHSLLEWSISACKRSEMISRIIVSTDSPTYASHSLACGAEVPFLRPQDISGDASTDAEFVHHALNWLDSNDESPDYFVHIRPTTPFRDPAVIDKAIATFQARTEMTALRSVHLMKESAYKCFEIGRSGYLQPIGTGEAMLDPFNRARQSFPDTYVANGYVDVLSCSYIRSSGNIHGDRVFPFKTPVSWEVDVEEDFAQLEYSLLQDQGLLSIVF